MQAVRNLRRFANGFSFFSLLFIALTWILYSRISSNSRDWMKQEIQLEVARQMKLYQQGIENEQAEIESKLEEMESKLDEIGVVESKLEEMESKLDGIEEMEREKEN